MFFDAVLVPVGMDKLGRVVVAWAGAHRASPERVWVWGLLVVLGSLRSAVVIAGVEAG